MPWRTVKSCARRSPQVRWFPATTGFPLGGLCGWVEYEGDFVFGDYPEMLVFSHTDQVWWEIGDLSGCLAGVEDRGFEITPFEAATNHREFIRGVERIREWIAAGDIYQVNLSQAFEAKVAGGSLFGLYEVLREASPAPMAAWLSLDGKEVLSSSPESFLKISGRVIETRPIKGTQAALFRSRRGPALGLRTPDVRQGNRRTGHDHRPSPQRFGAGLRVWQRRGVRDAATRIAGAGPPSGVHRRRHPAPGNRCHRGAGRVFSRWQHHRRAEKTRHGDHPRTREQTARHLLRSDRLSGIQ